MGAEDFVKWIAWTATIIGGVLTIYNQLPTSVSRMIEFGRKKRVKTARKVAIEYRLARRMANSKSGIFLDVSQKILASISMGLMGMIVLVVTHLDQDRLLNMSGKILAAFAFFMALKLALGKIRFFVAAKNLDRAKYFAIREISRELKYFSSHERERILKLIR
ncbi:MAG: hypothetical protein HQL40_04005 [Alphaproteobacteria bacterium]|nr:hypothetical protein [Alphaproteobacteria bacterium]